MLRPGNHTIKLKLAGSICQKEISKTIAKRKNVKINDYIIMPNHIHMIVEIHNIYNMQKDAARHVPTIYKNSLSSIICALKSAISKQYNEIMQKHIELWQPRFYEHIIRNEKEYFRIYKYMQNNPIRWLEKT